MVTAACWVQCGGLLGLGPPQVICPAAETLWGGRCRVWAAVWVWFGVCQGRQLLDERGGRIRGQARLGCTTARLLLTVQSPCSQASEQDCYCQVLSAQDPG